MALWQVLRDPSASVSVQDQVFPTSAPVHCSVTLEVQAHAHLNSHSVPGLTIEPWYHLACIAEGPNTHCNQCSALCQQQHYGAPTTSHMSGIVGIHLTGRLR